MALDYSVIGSRIRNARMSKKMTQEELANKLDVSIAFLSRIETGNSHINLNRLTEICNLLDVSEGYVLNGASSNSDKYLDEEFSLLLRSVSPKTQKLIYKVAKSIAEFEE